MRAGVSQTDGPLRPVQSCVNSVIVISWDHWGKVTPSCDQREFNTTGILFTEFACQCHPQRGRPSFNHAKLFSLWFVHEQDQKTSCLPTIVTSLRVCVCVRACCVCACVVCVCAWCVCVRVVCVRGVCVCVCVVCVCVRGVCVCVCVFSWPIFSFQRDQKTSCLPTTAISSLCDFSITLKETGRLSATVNSSLYMSSTGLAIV